MRRHSRSGEVAQVSGAISPRRGRGPRRAPRRVFFYFEIPSIHHASETRLAPPPPPPRSALPPPANLSFAFFHLSRSSCLTRSQASSSSLPVFPSFRLRVPYTTPAADFRAPLISPPPHPSLLFPPTSPRLRVIFDKVDVSVYEVNVNFCFDTLIDSFPRKGKLVFNRW